MVVQPAKIGAIVLGAGRSVRMGQPKLLLPWGEHTIIEEVVSVALAGGADQVVVVSGGSHTQVSQLMQKYTVKVIYNENYADGEMLSSLQCGLTAVGEGIEAVLIMLGDQPQVQQNVVDQLVRTYQEGGYSLIVPSYARRRGHPWLVRRDLWIQVLELRAPATLREFLNQQAGLIHYLEVDTDSILADIDTPEDYRRYRI